MNFIGRSLNQYCVSFPDIAYSVVGESVSSVGIRILKLKQYELRFTFERGVPVDWPGKGFDRM